MAREASSSRPRTVPLGDRQAFSEVLAEASSGALAPESVVILAAGDAGEVPEEALADLLAGPLGIGAVVPTLVDRRGRVVEAGTFLGPTGQLEPYGAGTWPWSADHSFRRDVPGSATHVLAVTAAVLAGLPHDHSPEAPGARAREVLAHVRAQGLRTVFEPSWVAPAPPTLRAAPAPAGPRRWAERDEATPVRVLVVTGNMPGTLVGAEHLVGLVSELSRCPGARVTLAVADGYGVPRYGGYFRRQGVEVVGAPQDWEGWCHDRRYHYSHLVVTDGGLSTRLWPLARATQPQAMAVLYSEQLPVRRHEALGEASTHVDGLQTVAQLLQGHLVRQVEGLDAAWCASEADAALLRGTNPEMDVVALGPWLAPQGALKGFADRQGVALVAVDSFDTARDPEDAVARALQDLVPAWRRRDIGLRVRVISDWPTPGLAHLAAQMGAEVVPSRGDLVAALAGVRLVAAPVRHGNSPATWLPAAVEAGTPWLCPPGPLEGTDWEGILPSSAVPEAAMGHRGWALLSEEAAWSAAAAELAEAHAQLSDRRQEALRRAFLGAGLDLPGPPAWPVERLVPHPATPPVSVAHRPATVADPPAIFVPDSLSEDERYELWHTRRGPNAEVVAAIAADAAAQPYQPTFSILMPVCDTEPWMLEEAVSSVVDQPYPHWQLCMADDASTRPETLAAIEAAARRDSRISVVHLEERSGISGATNAALALATGEFVCFLDHDDVLKPQALAQVQRWLNADPTLDLLYSDEDKLDPMGRLTEARWKPDWSPNLLLCQNYVCHFLTVRRSLLESLGGLRPEFDGSQDYDLVLRVSDVTDRIAHIPDCLYSWRMHAQSAALKGDKKPYAWLAGQRALGDWLARRERHGLNGGWSEEGAWFDVHRVRFKVPGKPRVSIVIPTRNGRHILGLCVESILSKTTYTNYELVVVDNQSDEPETLEYLSTLPGRVIRYPHEFNFPRQLNLAVASLETDALIFLNNDAQVITADWVERLLENAMRPEVGAVGPRLRLPDGAVQHEGIIIGLWRGHANSIEWGNWWRMGDLARDVSAVTGACMATRPGVYWRLGGYDERLRVAYNDVDFCLRLHQAGYQVVFEPDVELYHAEGSTRGRLEDPEDAPLFNERWRPRSSCDPYYNPNLNRNRLLFRVEP